MGGDRVPGPFNDAVDENDRRRRELIERHREGTRKSIQDALNGARAQDAADLLFFDNIAQAAFHSLARGFFIRKYADAWLHADAWTKRLMRPVFETLICKHKLEGLEEPGEDP